jgi:nucleotide-binding universal stress UspA family protein
MIEDSAVQRTQHSASRDNGAAPLIVVGVDGSPTSWDAFSWAAGEAMRSDGKLVAVYVMPFVEPAAGLGVPYDYVGAANTRQEIAAELSDEAARRARDIGVSVSFVSEYGDPTEALTDIARTLNANLIVVGRSAKIRHRLAGSLSHRLSCRKDAPVVVVVP